MRSSISKVLIVLAFGLAFVATFSVMGCKKDAPTSKAAPALPPQPPLKPLEDEFREPDSTVVVNPANPAYGQVPNGYYTLQIQLLQSKSAAARMAGDLKALGIPAYVAVVVDPKPELPGTFYRVRAGSFATTAAARHYGEINLKPLGRDYWVDLKARDSRPVVEVYKPRFSAPEPTPVPAYTPPAPAQPKIVEPVAPVQPQIVEPVKAATPPPAPAPVEPQAAPAPSTPLDPALVPKNLEGKPAVKEPADTGSVQDW